MPSGPNSISCRGNLAERLSGEAFDCVRLWRHGDIVDINREGQMFATMRRHITGEAFSGDEQPAIERIVSRKRSRFSVHFPSRRRLKLDVKERAVAPQDWQRVVKDLKVFLPGHVGEIADH